ncbi:MAG: sulfite exporter TauE/SafE family protein [Pseudomonadota bacterium]
MTLYLPIAELPINVFLIFGMGLAVGVISGMFGVGGGFLMTPLLIFSGIAPAIAVATMTAQVTAASFSGALTYYRRGALDLKLALVLTAGGLMGAALGVAAFQLLQRLGQLDVVIALAYVFFLGTVGSLMFWESIGALIRARKGHRPNTRKPGQHSWVHGLPFKMRFPRSRIYLSVFPVLGLGGAIGFLGSVLGIGGGFMLVPALIYLLRVPASVVVGTSLMQIVLVMAGAAFMHAITNGGVDVVLALVLMVGSTIGAQLGATLGAQLRAEHLRVLLAVLVLGVGLRFAVDLIATPDAPYSIELDRRS